MSGPTRDSGGVSRTRNVLSNWGAYVLGAVVNFFLAPFVVHSLGDASYGIWVLLGSLVGYLGLLDLGVRSAVTRYVARLHAQKDHDEASRVASSALGIFTVAGLVAIAAATVVAVVIDRVFQVPRDLVVAARVVVVLGGINVAVALVSGVFGGAVVGLQRFDRANAVEIVVGAFRVVAIVLTLKAGLGLVALAGINLAASLLSGSAMYWLSRRLYPELRVVFGEFRRRHVNTILTFSISVLLLQASGMLILYTDSVVIGASLPVGMITLFAIAANLVEYARSLVSGISYTVTPWVSALQARDALHEVQQVLLDAARIATLVVLPIVITFMLRGSTFIGLWMGPEYAGPSGEVLRILGLALSLAVGYQVMVATMMGISRHDGLVAAFAIEAVCNIGLSVVWVQRYGIIGVAWGTTVPRVIATVVFAPWYTRRVLGTPISRFWLDAWIRPAAAMILFAGGSYLVERWWIPTNLLYYFTQVALVLPLAAVGAWTVGITKKEKEALLSRVFGERMVGRIGG